MTPAHVTRGNKRYRYYTCSPAQRNGWHTCPSKSVPALALERFVLEQIAAHARHVAWPTLAPAEQGELQPVVGYFPLFVTRFLALSTPAPQPVS
jgi:hypothetical protein